MPTLETNYSGIKEVLDGLVRSYKGKEDEFGVFQKEHGIQVSLGFRGVGSRVKEGQREEGKRRG